MNRRLAGKRALVTGGSRGIGLAIARRYAEEGADIALLSRTAGRLRTAARAVEQSAHSPAQHVTTAPADVRELPAVDRAIGQVAGALGGIDVLVNAAGIASLGAIDVMPPDEWIDMVQTNLVGAYHVTRAAWPHLKQRGGSIVMIVSGSGRRAHANWSAYCASKFGLMGLADALAKEGRPLGIRCNVLCPGPTDTDQRASNFPDEDPSRLLSPDDVARAAVFFASDESRWVSGPGIDVRREPI